jgi:hypothetical protein
MSARQQITITWEGPEGRIRVGITHIRNCARGHDRLEIRTLDPPDAPLPFGGASPFARVYRAADIRKAGGAARFAERLILDAARSSGVAPAEAPGADAERQPDTSRHTPAPHPLESELLTRKTYTLAWNSPAGPVVLTITHTRTFFCRAHVVDIAVPPHTPFPLDTLSYIVTDPDIRRAGDAKAFVESLIAAAEGTAAWRSYAARAAQTDLFGIPGQAEPPVRARPGRPRLKLPGPRR